ncbi:MAG: hypothetical protein NTZ09_03000 [Candidatus Hydrogenedentes bacterium]|nr:hypothetical protein [Candidatus Hydrogenedentota bacterium]
MAIDLVDVFHSTAIRRKRVRVVIGHGHPYHAIWLKLSFAQDLFNAGEPPCHVTHEPFLPNASRDGRHVFCQSVYQHVQAFSAG